jgi:hypothetical protein
MNEREVVHEGSVLCRACAGSAYFVSVGPQLLTVGFVKLPAEA